MHSIKLQNENNYVCKYHYIHVQKAERCRLLEQYLVWWHMADVRRRLIKLCIFPAEKKIISVRTYALSQRQ